jgi:hypothetical protein
MGTHYESLLQNWDASEEQKRSDFLEYLYEFYEVTDGLYTGLWIHFCVDIGCITRDLILDGSLKGIFVDDVEVN